MEKRNLQFCFVPLFLLILFSFAGPSQAVAGGDDPRQKIGALKEENQLLEAELQLASQGRTYIIMELGMGSDLLPVRISLKNRGIVLREFDAGRMRYRRVRLVLTEPIPLVKKTAFFPIKRKEIKPRKSLEEGDGAAELDFLELKDMPSNYALTFGNGLFISITSHPEGFVSRIIHLVRLLLMHIYHSFMIAWNHLWREEFAIVEITMKKQEAQSLYWSLEEGMRILIMEGRLQETA